MLDATKRLSLGLWALDYVQTASITPDWERWGKFGRGAYYVILHTCKFAGKTVDGKPHLFTAMRGDLWHSSLHVTTPQRFVGDGTQESPVFDQFWNAGLKAHELEQAEQALPADQAMAARVKKARMVLDADAVLDELKGGSDEVYQTGIQQWKDRC